MSANNGNRSLLAHHCDMLKASAIADDVAAERGYFSVERKHDLEQLGFSRTQQLVPGLVIPIHGVVAGEGPWFIYRPDTPRVKDGRPSKYEIPAGRRMALDIHPRARAHLADPKAGPVFITEGSKKVDALISAGARAVVGVIGVWNWRGRNDQDGLAILPDWEWVHLKDRQIYIVYDSDIILKEPVALAMNRLGAALQRTRGAVAYTRLPSGSSGEKVGVDDFLAAGHRLDDIVRLSSISPPEPPSTSVGGSGGSELRATVQHPPALAYEGDILGQLIKDLHRLGHVGEERACKLVYLSATSRLLAQIVSLVAKGPSAAGKSATIDRVLSFLPDDAVIRLSGMSEKYLVYDDRPIEHKMLVLHEAAGMGSEFSTYLIRTLLSEGCLRHGTVESTPGGLRPVLVERKGPAGLITSTTQISLHSENETRLVSVPIDDTRAQTARVMAAIASSNGQTVDLKPWHQLQHWLEDGERRVVIPFAKPLAYMIPPIAVRLRRDFGAVLGLTRAHALLHRATRDIDEGGQIVATFDDYAVVRELMLDLVSDAIGAGVSDETRQTVDVVANLISGDDRHAKTAQVAERLNLDRTAAYRRITKALSQGYLVNDAERRGQPMQLRLGDPLPEDQVILPSREDLEEGCCTVARGSASPHPPTDVDDEDEERAEYLFERYGDGEAKATT